jgi:hypothetical protein
MPELLPAVSGIQDPSNPLTFAFGGGGGAGTPGLQELKRRQAIAQMLAGQKRPFPKNIGEGLTSLGEAVGDRMTDARLTAQERAFGAAEDQRVNAANALPSVQVPGARTAPVVPAVPAVPARPVVPRPTASVTSPDDARPEDPRERIAALFAGGAGGPPENPTVAGVTPPQTGSPASDDDGLWGARSAAIGGIETGGTKDPYRTIGEANTKYGRALGKYGVMTANVAPWTRAALGQALTPEQYLASDEAQDAVFKHRFGQYVARFGEEGAARAWFGGPGNVNKAHLTDAYERLSIGDYGKDYLRRLQGAAPNAGTSAPDGADAGATMTIDSATGVSPDEGPNPVTPTSIQPAPGARTGVRTTSDTLPSQSAVPPASVQFMADPGPEPVPPDRVDFSPKQREMIKIMNNRNFSDDAKAFAKQQFEIEEKIRSELTARREADYTHARTRWDKRRDEKDKFDREADDRGIDQMIKRGAIEKAQAELEEMYFKRGVPRQQAVEQAGLEIKQKQLGIAKSEREAGTWDEKVIDGQIWRARPATATTPQGPWEVAPGSPKKENLTETQAKTVKFMQRAVVASSQLGDASILAGLVDTAKGKLPVGGNYWVSPEYQKAQNAAFTWAQAVLRDESGAVLGAGEIANKMKAYFPQPGDNEQTIRDKAFRRKAEEETFYHALGDRKKVIDDWREERKGRRVPTTDTGKPTIPEGTLRVNNRTGARQRVMGGHWENEEDLH